VMLLDDVMSELDGRRRRALVDLLREGGGQSVITATDPEQVPGSLGDDVHRIQVAASGEIEQEPALPRPGVGA
jgi:recombinational DNA repair ATPase RecF